MADEKPLPAAPTQVYDVPAWEVVTHPPKVRSKTSKVLSSWQRGWERYVRNSQTRAAAPTTVHHNRHRSFREALAAVGDDHVYDGDDLDRYDFDEEAYIGDHELVIAEKVQATRPRLLPVRRATGASPTTLTGDTPLPSSERQGRRARWKAFVATAIARLQTSAPVVASQVTSSLSSSVSSLKTSIPAAVVASRGHATSAATSVKATTSAALSRMQASLPPVMAQLRTTASALRPRSALLPGALLSPASLRASLPAAVAHVQRALPGAGAARERFDRALPPDRRYACGLAGDLARSHFLVLCVGLSLLALALVLGLALGLGLQAR